MGGDGRVSERRGHERAAAGPGSDETVVLELAVRLEHRVRVDRQLRHDLLDGRQLIALAQQPEPQRLAHLADELLERRHARTQVQMELDHHVPSFI